MNEKENRRRNTRCSFCGKSQDRVRKLIAGPGVFICDECVDLCNDVIREDDQRSAPGFVAPQGPRRRARFGWFRSLFRVHGYTT